MFIHLKDAHGLAYYVVPTHICKHVYMYLLLLHILFQLMFQESALQLVSATLHHCGNYNPFKDLSVPYEELQFKQLISRGSFGEVHRGEWNGNDVALKRITIPTGEDKFKMIANSAEIAALKWVHFNMMHFLNVSIYLLSGY